MVNGWVKSLQCRSNAADDVYHSNPPPPPRRRHRASKGAPTLLPLGCGHNTSQALRDVVSLFPKHPLSRRVSSENKSLSSSSRALLETPPPSPPLKQRRRQKPSKTRICASSSSPFPTLAELPAGHSSRRVVEIIFSSSWSRKGNPSPFPGVIEMVFKVKTPARTIAWFEEYREDVRSRAGTEDARCAANGNEMMRFHCGAEGPVYDAGIVCSATASGGVIRTFAGSGGAHESAVAAPPGRRKAMLVCRVIAGRVRTSADVAGEFESVSVGKGELLVFDPRAVLPCFLIIYRV